MSVIACPSCQGKTPSGSVACVHCGALAPVCWVCGGTGKCKAQCDGTSATDPIRVPIKLAANGCIIGGLPAVTFATGIFVDRESGTTELVLYLME